MQWHYNVVHSGGLLWIQIPIYVLPQWLQYSMKYHVVLDYILMALDCICFGMNKRLELNITWTNHDPLYWCMNPLPGINTLRPTQNGRHFSDDTFKCIFLNENVLIPNEISLKFVPKGPINNIPALVQIMTWHWPGNKLLSESMMIKLLTHVCVTRPQWVEVFIIDQNDSSSVNKITSSHNMILII